MKRDVSELPHDERLMQDEQYRARWAEALVAPFNPPRTEDIFDIHDRLHFRAEIIRAGDRKTADLLMSASREIARLEAANEVLRDRVEVAVEALARHRPLPEGGTE